MARKRVGRLLDGREEEEGLLATKRDKTTKNRRRKGVGLGGGTTTEGEDFVDDDDEEKTTTKSNVFAKLEGFRWWPALLLSRRDVEKMAKHNENIARAR